MGALDLLSNALHEEPNSTGYVIVYGARHGYRNDIKQRMKCMKDYLIQRRRISADSLRVVNGGYRAHVMIELWIAPSGSSAPVSTPTVSPRDVRSKRGGTKYTCDL
jgi:hypothetical protein